MSEIIYANQKTHLPKNIRQIGSIEEGYHIYIEDYVYTYIYELAQNEMTENSVAVLIGKQMIEEGKQYVMVDGAVEGKYVVAEGKKINFTNKTWQYVEECLEKYYPNQQILGWSMGQIGYGLFLNSDLLQTQKNYFPKPYQIMCLIDPIEKKEAFYRWEKDKIQETNGFFIYYDRNDAMQEYKLDRKVFPRHKIMEPEQDVPIEYRRRRPRGKEETRPNKVINMLSTLSAVLFVICLLMGFGMLSNLEKVNALEQTMAEMDTHYTEVKEALKNIGQPISGSMDLEPASNSPGSTSVASNDTTTLPVIPTADLEPEDMNPSFPEVTDVEMEPTQESNDTVPLENPEGDAEVRRIIEENTEHSETTAEPVNPTEGAEETGSAFPTTYVVKAGDNLNRISYQIYKTTDMVEAILDYNGISNPNKIYIGQTLELPTP